MMTESIGMDKKYIRKDQNHLEREMMERKDIIHYLNLMRVSVFMKTRNLEIFERRDVPWALRKSQRRRCNELLNFEKYSFKVVALELVKSDEYKNQHLIPRLKKIVVHSVIDSDWVRMLLRISPAILMQFLAKNSVSGKERKEKDFQFELRDEMPNDFKLTLRGYSKNEFVRNQYRLLFRGRRFSRCTKSIRQARESYMSGRRSYDVPRSYNRMRAHD
jgi:hypothetical protein